MALVAAQDYGARRSSSRRRLRSSIRKLFEAQELLAYLALEDTDETLAAKEADKALAISPEALDGMAIRATIDFLHDKKESPWIDRILKINPVYGEAYSTAAHFFFINRRYDEGIASYRKALDLNPRLWDARVATRHQPDATGPGGRKRARNWNSATTPSTPATRP